MIKQFTQAFEINISGLLEFLEEHKGTEKPTQRRLFFEGVLRYISTGQTSHRSVYLLKHFIIILEELSTRVMLDT